MNQGKSMRRICLILSILSFAISTSNIFAASSPASATSGPFTFYACDNPERAGTFADQTLPLALSNYSAFGNYGQYIGQALEASIRNFYSAFFDGAVFTRPGDQINYTAIVFGIYYMTLQLEHPPTADRPFGGIYQLGYGYDYNIDLIPIPNSNRIQIIFNINRPSTCQDCYLKIYLRAQVIRLLKQLIANDLGLDPNLIDLPYSSEACSTLFASLTNIKFRLDATYTPLGVISGNPGSGGDSQNKGLSQPLINSSAPGSTINVGAVASNAEASKGPCDKSIRPASNSLSLLLLFALLSFAALALRQTMRFK